jgi:hypothetical protein
MDKKVRAVQKDMKGRKARDGGKTWAVRQLTLATPATPGP